MAKNDSLHKAKRAKADEFYTQLSDIENECRHYKEHFRGKTILCNCDDPRVSNFFRYFSLNFEHLGLKKLIATCYKSQDINLFSEGNTEKAVYIVYDGDKNGNKKVDDNELDIKELQGDGDFRSKECIELLKEADIVVTNPPFSLFREYVALLMEYEKRFLIIGNKNALTYKEVFSLLKANKIWTGVRGFSGGMWFKSDYEGKTEKIITDKEGNAEKIINVPSIWFTNLDHSKRHERLILYETYTPEKYPKYSNYNVIEVSKTAEIPVDYDGVMGVPISFMDKYNPEQFEIIGMAEDNGKGLSGEAAEWDGVNPHCIINGKAMYKRIFIRKK
jgi:hypothetical protein